MISCACPACGRKFRAKDDAVGKMAGCRSCGNLFSVAEIPKMGRSAGPPRATDSTLIPAATPNHLESRPPLFDNPTESIPDHEDRRQHGILILGAFALAILCLALVSFWIMPARSSVVLTAAKTSGGDEKRDFSSEWGLLHDCPVQTALDQASESSIPSQYGFGRKEWEGLVAKADSLGIIRGRDDALRLAPALHEMKTIFVEVGIANPTPNQLFNGVRAFTGGGGFESFGAEAVEKTLMRLKISSHQSGIRIGTRAQFEQLETTSNISTID